MGPYDNCLAGNRSFNIGPLGVYVIFFRQLSDWLKCLWANMVIYEMLTQIQTSFRFHSYVGIRNYAKYDPNLTHWGRVTHICVSKLTIIGSDNSLSPGRRRAIIWTNAGILLIRTLGTNFSEILDEIHSFSFSKMHLKLSSAKWRLFGLGLNELINSITFIKVYQWYPHTDRIY